MSNDVKVNEKVSVFKKRQVIITFLGTIIMILLILTTLEAGHRNIDIFVSSQQRYIIAMEAAILAIFIVEMLVGLLRFLIPPPHMADHGSHLLLIVRIVGYAIALSSVTAILASNPTLGISVGAIAGIVIAFATQNILGSVIATVLILSTRMVRIGEEITISQTTGTISDISLTHTVLSIDENVVFVPNSPIVSSIIQRKKRNTDKDAGVRDW